jgi:hypothetical protein
VAHSELFTEDKMAGPVVAVDLPGFQNNLRLVPEALTDSIRKEIKHQLVEIHKLAMKKHRHTTRTGMLNNSLQRQMNSDFEGSVYFDTGIANYGVYVHEGHGSWEPDQFLYAALDARAPLIEADLEKAINVGLTQAGLK